MTGPIDWTAWGEDGHVYASDYRDGRHDAEAHLWFIHAEADVTVRAGAEVLEIGRAGADGITFCLRRGAPGIWAHHPIEDRFVQIADDLPALERGCMSGRIKV